MSSPSKNAAIGDVAEAPRDTASLGSYKHSRDRVRHHSASMGSGSFRDNFDPQYHLQLNAEPLNPCGCCYITKQDEAAKLWATVNLAVAVVQTCYKWWVTLMLSGGSVPYLRPYTIAYVSYCTKTQGGKGGLTGKGYCFDVIGQLVYVLGSIVFVVATGKFKEFKPHRRIMTRLYMGSIVAYAILAYVPQTLFWFFDGHCIPPNGMSLCEATEKEKLVIVPGPYKEEKSCFPITHTYFTLVYVSTTAVMFPWWLYGFTVGHSHLYLLKRLKHRDGDATAPAALLEGHSRGRNRRDRDRSKPDMVQSELLSGSEDKNARGSAPILTG